ncbi:MAG: glycosyltransferase [Deltaproteobacteria bacterium]|nr:glycosyltransferase [Deltaproteobacteria bacterium]
MHIVLGNSSLVKYQHGGGLWSWFLQYPMALKAAGHDVFWLELLQSSGSRETDLRTMRHFYDRLRPYDLTGNCALLLFHHALDSQPFEDAEVFGASTGYVRRLIAESDLLLNFSCALRQPLLSLFKRRALLDGDPGHLQISLSIVDLDFDLDHHDVFLTVGTRINAPDSIIPKLGHEWQTFEQLIYLPLWKCEPELKNDSPFTSITQWTWEELHYGGRIFSVSKRDAYLKYLRLPQLVDCSLELAANIGQSDTTGDHALLSENGWRLVDPHQVASCPARYHEYIRDSRGEFMCPKPIHVQLRTGWFSERSLAYLASGRPVVAEETGFSERIPTGIGLLAFHDLSTAAAAIAEVDANYERHRRAARELVEAYFDWRKTVETILSACA